MKRMFCRSVLACLAGAAVATTAFAVPGYPNGARGDDGLMDANGGFYPESRQLDFDLLTNVLQDLLIQ